MFKLARSPTLLHSVQRRIQVERPQLESDSTEWISCAEPRPHPKQPNVVERKHRRAQALGATAVRRGPLIVLAKSFFCPCAQWSDT